MSTFPSRLANRAAATIASTADLVKNAHQRINVLGSQVASLTPGSWENISLSGGWSNLAGYIPAQAQIIRAGAVQIVGHITGGTTTDGTVIATLDSGYFNTGFAHSFTANVMSGAAAVSVAGTISGSTDSNGLSNPAIGGTTTSNGLTDPTVTGTSSSTVATSGVGHTHGAGSYDINNGYHIHQLAASVNNGYHVHTNNTGGQVPATPVNYNTAMLKLTTAGELVIYNCPSAATQVSFNETLPLIGT